MCRAAAYVEKIRKGAKPANLPIGLVINRKTGADLGVDRRSSRGLTR